MEARSQEYPQRRQEGFKAKGTSLKKAEQTALMLLMVTASQLNGTTILFSAVYPSSSFT